MREQRHAIARTPQNNIIIIAKIDWVPAMASCYILHMHHLIRSSFQIYGVAMLSPNFTDEETEACRS